jgi:hypothetical protein
MSGIVVVYYSRYSKDSLDFLKEVEQLTEVRKLCVDNAKIREKILLEKENYDIRVVPSVLIFHSNGFLEKQNGHVCFEWLKSITPEENVEPVPIANLEDNPVLPPKTPEMKVSIADVSFEPRKLETYPLVEQQKDTNQPEETKNIDEQIKDEKSIQAQNSVTKNNTNESIMTMAQQMQKQREMEDKNISSN